MNQKGFTLIELVVVIVVLGILAAVAVPKFVDLTEDAEKASVKGVAGSLASASAMNFGKFKANPTSSEAKAVKGCGDTADLMENWDTGKYSVSGDAYISGNTLDCYAFTTNTTPQYSASFTAFYVSK